MKERVTVFRKHGGGHAILSINGANVEMVRASSSLNAIEDRNWKMGQCLAEELVQGQGFRFLDH